MELLVIIVNYKSDAWVKRCVASIPKRKDWEIIIEDNSVVNRGFGKACNDGAEKAGGKYLLFINPDCVVGRGAIEKMLMVLKKRKEVGIVGPALVDEARKPYLSFTGAYTRKNAFVVLSFLNRLFKKSSLYTRFWMADKPLTESGEVANISGAVMLMRRHDFLAWGGFDEQFFMYFEDADICRQARRHHFKIWYCAEAQVLHARGGSTNAKAYRVTRWFRQSRYRYFKKYEGVVYAIGLETFLELFEEWKFIAIFIWATWMRFWAMPELSPLIGDQAKDYLAAMDSLRQFKIPLLGIESSLPRFRQGPVFVWILMAVFGIFGTQAAAPVYAAATLSLAGVVATYLLVREYFNETAAYVATILLATSPMVVAHGRMAFMTVPIVLASAFFLFTLLKKREQARHWALPFLGFGLLYQFELAYFPLLLLPLAALILQLYKSTNKRRQYVQWSLLGLGIGLWPQLLYDLTHRFSQLGMFLVWVAYRIAKAMGFFGGVHYGDSLRTMGQTMYTYFSSYISWDLVRPSVIAGVILLIYFFRLAYTRFRYRRSAILASYGLVLVGAYAVHGAPSEAYFPVLFVPLAVIIGITVSRLPRLLGVGFMVGILGLAVYNTWFMWQHDFLLLTEKTAGENGYAYYGLPLITQQAIATRILEKAQGRPIHLISRSETPQPDSLLDPYRFLIQIDEGTLDNNGYPVAFYFGQYAIAPPVSEVRIERIQGVVIGFPVERQ